MFFSLIDRSGREAICDIERSGNIIIATEIYDNSGMSVTNAASEIAAKCCQDFGINATDLIFVERYNENSYMNAPKNFSETYSLVTFSLGRKKGKLQFLNPKWRHLKDEELQGLIKNK